MPNILVDPESRSLEHRFAVIRAPRRDRARFPAACVQVAADESAARTDADPARQLYAAEVYGPSVSSEGQRIYYLVRWLDRP